MDIDKYIKISMGARDLSNEAWTLIKSLSNDNESDVNDWCKMYRVELMKEDFMHLADFLIELNLMFYGMENEKDKFVVQKVNYKYAERVKESLNSLIKIGRTWKFSDYRCIDWIKRMGDSLGEFKQFFDF